MKATALRVLVVDDERFFREAISETLNAAGIESDKVSNGQEALKAIEDHRIGVVVLDIGLAGMSGLEVLRRMRVARSSLRVIVLSGALDQESVLEALRIWSAAEKSLMWRGTSTDTLSDKPEKNEKKINKGMEKLFKDFPPEEK